MHCNGCLTPKSSLTDDCSETFVDHFLHLDNHCVSDDNDGDSEDGNIHENHFDGDEEDDVVKEDRRFIDGGLISNSLVGIASTGIYAAFLQKCKTLILPNNKNLDRENIWEHKSQAAAAVRQC